MIRRRVCSSGPLGDEALGECIGSSISCPLAMLSVQARHEARHDCAYAGPEHVPSVPFDEHALAHTPRPPMSSSEPHGLTMGRHARRAASSDEAAVDLFDAAQVAQHRGCIYWWSLMQPETLDRHQPALFVSTHPMVPHVYNCKCHRKEPYSRF